MPEVQIKAVLNEEHLRRLEDEAKRRVRELIADRGEPENKTIIPGDELEVDFASGTITFRSKQFRFPPLGAVPQALVVAGGVENQVRERLGLS